MEVRGLAWVELVVSDAHEDLAKGIEAAFPGSMWQQCHTHFIRRALGLVWETDKACLCEDLS